MCLAGGLSPAHGQILEPHRIRIGGGLGAGGLHFIFKPSLDLHWRRMMLRAAPGLFYWSASFSYRVGYYRPRRRQDRPLFLHAVYANDWALTTLRRRLNQNTFKLDQEMFMLLLGIRAKMDFRSRVYLDFSLGPAVIHERYAQPLEGPAVPDRWRVYPMAEFRIGGVIQRHKVHHQYLPGQERLRRERFMFWKKDRGLRKNRGSGVSSRPTTTGGQAPAE
jgi:hypothetical protein